MEYLLLAVAVGGAALLYGRHIGAMLVIKTIEENKARELEADHERHVNATYWRIYHQKGYPGLVTISGNAYDRKQQEAKNCVTLGWVVRQGFIIWVESA